VQVTDAEGSVLAEIAEGLGETTNNVAEYTAVIEGLKCAAALGASRVLVRSDSQLLVFQLTGAYRVRTSHLVVLHRQVLEQAKRFERVRFEHVRRERNAEADRLANEGVDAWLAARHRA
jgi:ribonuclease HI